MKVTSPPALPSIAAAITALILTAIGPATHADWPQWRGPDRNGIAGDGTKLIEQLTEGSELKRVWQSEEVPSDHYGGHGSVAVSGGRVYLSVVWHRDEPTDQRTIDNDVLANLGHRSTGFDDELTKKFEDARLNINPRLRGTGLEEWAQKWVDENLSEDQNIKVGSWVVGRFKQGKSALDMAIFDTLREMLNKPFAGQAELETWVAEQNFGEAIGKRILDAVPNTKKVADDSVLCLDADTGETVWKFSKPGHPSGRSSSSTPAIVDGRVYAALSTHLYALDAATGDLIWESPLTERKGPASSPLVLGDRIFLQQNRLTAYATADGKQLWQNSEVAGANQSPTSWSTSDGDVIVCNGSNEVFGVDAASGETLWKMPGGGDSTPVVSGDHLVVASKTAGHNLSAYRLISGTAPELLWEKDFLTRRYGASPIVYQGHVYHLGSARHWCLDLDSGEVAWERPSSSEISSPALADGKLFVYENGGGYLAMLKATPEDYQPLGRAKVGALRCASPAIVGSRIYLRAPDSVYCFELGAGAP